MLNQRHSRARYPVHGHSAQDERVDNFRGDGILSSCSGTEGRGDKKRQSVYREYPAPRTSRHGPHLGVGKRVKLSRRFDA